MLRNIIRFELKYQISSPLFIGVFLLFFLLTFGGATVDEVQIGSTAAVNMNSPHAVSMNILIWSIFGMFIPTAFLVSGILRDTAYNTEGLFYSTPVKEKSYLLGRFIGGFTATALVFVSVPLAFLLGSVMPWLDPETVGPINIGQYAYIYLVLGIPNLLVAGLIFFTVANFTRSNTATYVALVGMLILYFMGQALLNNEDWRYAVALADPFAINAYSEMVRYWTPAELNSLVVPLEGVFLQNRLIWLAIAAGLFVLNFLTFSFRKRSSFFARRAKQKGANDEVLFVPRHISLPVTEPGSGAGVALAQLRARTAFEVKGVVKNVAFYILLVLGVMNTAGVLLSLDGWYGTPTYPVTRMMINLIMGGFSIVPLVVVIYYSAELVWREKNVGFSDIVDATPVPSWVIAVAKLIGMAVVIFGLFSVAMLTGIGAQIFKQYDQFEIGQYAVRLLLLPGYDFLMLAALAIFAQVISGNKWLGMLIMVVVMISQMVLSNMGFEHKLYQFGSTTSVPYTDMNGYGHFLGIALWYYAYWGFVSVLLLVAAFLMWNRGPKRSLVSRIRAIPTQFSRPVGFVAGVALLGAGLTGSWIYYNTNVLNPYVTSQEQERLTALYEKTYKHLADVPQPKVTDVDINVDIYPEDRRYVAHGTYLIENKTEAPISTVYMGYGPSATIKSQALEGAALTESDEEMYFYTFTFDEPMMPGAQREFTFVVAQENPGFKNSGNNSLVRYNGTFFNNGQVMPSIGYNDQAILIDPKERRRQGLEPAERAPKLEEEANWYVGAFGKGADFVTFKTTVSTSADQIAVAPGYLKKEWTEGDRRYFSYEMDAPIFNYYAWLSGRYEVERDSWNGLPLEIYYHQGHDYNLDVMMKSIKDSLSYYTENFSPYQHRQVRILEFPAYATFAQSFSNTIPYSEGIGFLSDLRDPKDLNVVYYVTAHEVAHQWWAHQAVPANVQGAAMPSESFSQYSALMVMEHEYGPDHMRRFLKYELDQYLRTRGSEIIEEMPLYKVENQAYIHYQKGSLSMYALKDYLGEERVNKVLAKLLEERAFSSAPYTTSLDFLRILREEAGPEWEFLISDLFEKIVLFDLKVEEAEAVSLDDGTWEVTMKVSAQKFEADGQGEQTEVPINYMIDVGIFSKDLDDVLEGTTHVLFMEKKAVSQNELEIKVIVDEKPLYAGIDPYNKLVDRNSDDNLKKITFKEG